MALVAAGTWFHLWPQDLTARWLSAWPQIAHLDAIAAAATLVGGYPIFKEALGALSRRRMTMELSMTLALVAALAIGQAFTALVITLFVLIAEVLEDLTVDRGRRAIRDLVDLLPRQVVVRDGEDPRSVAIAEVVPGDTVLVRPGSRIPVDGRVVQGTTFVDQSSVTGESVPVEKIVGSAVYAGTLNQSGAIEVEVASIGPDTAFGQIVQAVERAEKNRAPLQKTADRLSGYLVYFALAAAALTYLLTRDPRSTLSVILVAGACGVAAGTPLALLGGIGQAARRGAIVKGGLFLEQLAGVDTIVLDKTGTLTLGDLAVVEVCPAVGVSDSALIEAAASAELRSEHPLGAAILERAGTGKPPEPDRFDYVPGRGIRCAVGDEEILVGTRALLDETGVADIPELLGAEHLTQVLVARGGKYLGRILVADTLRPEAARAVSELHRAGYRLVLLTGDAWSVARHVGRDLGISEIEAELLPADKEARIQALVAAGHKVAMIGDGLNDAPALVQASVGIAMGTGADVAQEAADILLLGNDLLKFVETIQIARRTRAVIFFNFGGTLVVDALGMALAGFGFLNPLLAALIHVTSELVFILNSARLSPALARRPGASTPPRGRGAAQPGPV